MKSELFIKILKNILSLTNVLLFGLGSFLCFVVAVVQSQDRLLFGGIFLLLITFANHRILYYLFKKND